MRVVFVCTCFTIVFVCVCACVCVCAFVCIWGWSSKHLIVFTFPSLFVLHCNVCLSKLDVIFPPWHRLFFYLGFQPCVTDLFPFLGHVYFSWCKPVRLHSLILLDMTKLKK
eukprot:scpid75124/ scgid12998/ 